ncbi:MAG: T9SS type A sorting domain-containing protein [Chitinophagales bacterium]|nr:T9SS type A sorting domain-containing protein [Chitinophagales bacterium]
MSLNTTPYYSRLLTVLCVCLLSVFSVGKTFSQSCIVISTPEVPGYCDDIFYPCNQKNASETPDLLNDKYDYTLTTVPNYFLAQKFGRIGNGAQDNTTLKVKIFTPENNANARPVILYSPLSSFSNSNINGPVTNYICSYFAKKGYTVLAYESRKFNIKRSTMNASTTLFDYIDNPYYLSDTAILNDFIRFRDNQITQDYGFFDLMLSISKAANGQQIAHDAYLEMLYKNVYDIKYLMDLVVKYKNPYDFDVNNIFLMGGSAAAAQALHAGYLNHPNDLDSIFDSVLMVYQGLNAPNPGNVSSDFNHEPNLIYNAFPKAVVNLWGIITTLDIINAGDPALFSVHGTWDDVFPFQIRKDAALGIDVGFGSEGIYCKAKEEGLHTDLFAICRGRHSLYPSITTSCGFTDEFEKILFDEILKNIGVFLAEEVSNLSTTNDIFTKNSPRYYATEAPTITLAPPPNNSLLDSNYHCPLVYPEQFNLNLYLNHPNNNKLLQLKPDKESVSRPEIEISGRLQVIPNPFSNNVKIVFNLDGSSEVSLMIHDLNGKLVHTAIQNVVFSKGSHHLTIGTDEFNSGTYSVSLILAGKVFSEKMVKM